MVSDDLLETSTAEVSEVASSMNQIPTSIVEKESEETPSVTAVPVTPPTTVTTSPAVPVETASPVVPQPVIPAAMTTNQQYPMPQPNVAVNSVPAAAIPPVPVVPAALPAGQGGLPVPAVLPAGFPPVRR